MSLAYNIEQITVMQRHDGQCMGCMRPTSQVLLRNPAGARAWVVIDRAITDKPKYLTEHRCLPPAAGTNVMSFKGQLNRYTCEACKGEIITIDRDDGVTPFMICCRVKPGCRGLMRSSCYHEVKGTPTYEWRKPTKEEFMKFGPAMRDHVRKGGLDIYPLQ